LTVATIASPSLHGPPQASRVVACDLAFVVSQPTELVLQIVASRSAGPAVEERLEVLADGGTPLSLLQLAGPNGATMHIVQADPGRVTVAYRARIGTRAPEPPGAWRAPAVNGSPEHERQVYLRPSRYCPSDHLTGFAVAEFGAGPNERDRIAAITGWIRERIGYVPGSGTVHDSAEHTLLTGVGTCRDFAHLGIALCRATGVSARFASVYAPGLSPMDFHAVFEAFEDGRWRVHDPTGLAPRPSLVRVATGRDAADTAFAGVNGGLAELDSLEVAAIAQPVLPSDDHTEMVELA
jgi:hypothetical protein